MPLIYVNDKTTIDKKNSNVIITKQPMIMGDTIDYLRQQRFQNVYVANENILFANIESLDDIIKYFDRVDFNKPFLNYLEVNVVDHCNLNCKGCAHFSNVSNRNFVSLDSFTDDLKIISEKFNLYYFRLLGGEPLLHPNIVDLVKIARAILKKTTIVLVTNGLLIPKLDDKVLQSFADNNIIISISLYKPTSMLLNDIREKLDKYNIKYLINDNYYNEPEVIDFFQTRLSTKKVLENNNVHKICTGRFLRNGKISKCYYSLLIDILNKKYGVNFELSDSDYVDLHEISDGWKAIDKLTQRIPFCDYCSELLYEFNWQGHCKGDKDISSFVLKRKMI